MKVNKKKGLLFLALCTLGMGMSLLQASQEPPYIKQKSSEAAEILKQAYNYVGSLEKFSIDALTINDDLYEGMIIEVKQQRKLIVERPGSLYIATRGDGKQRNYYLHKGLFTIFDTEHHYYTQFETPKSIDGTLDYIFDRYDIKTPLANILYSDIAERLKPKAQGHYFGLTRIGKRLCHYIGFSNKNSELQMWIDADGEPRILKFVVIDKTGEREMRSTSWLRWNKQFPKKDYSVFHAPGDAVKVKIEVPEGRE